jgi:hypothetical protein
MQFLLEHTNFFTLAQRNFRGHGSIRFGLISV